MGHKNLPFENKAVMLAPMVGLSHIGLRRSIRNYLPYDCQLMWPSEMLSSWMIPKQELGTYPQTYKDERDYPFVPQILGNEEQAIAASVKCLQEWGVQGIDINMGCPVKKALKHNYGVALMGDIDYAAKVVAMTKKHSHLPISVKLRAGHQNDKKFLKDFVLALEDAGCDWITLHPRTTGQKRRGKADWQQIAWIKSQVNIPVIGNGDIQCVEDIQQMFEVTGCDGVMVGRAATARPWIFAEYLNKNSMPIPQTSEEEAKAYFDFLIFFIHASQIFNNEYMQMRKLKFLVQMGHWWLEYGHQFMSQLSKCKSSEQAIDLATVWRNKRQKMAKRTQLRI